MTITVVGHLCLDVIHSADGSETRGYGGIFFSIATLANLLGPRDTIYPVFGIGKSDYEALIERLSQYPNVDTSGIYKFNGQTNEVHLYYQDAAERIECSRYIAEPIPFKKIRPYLETNLVLVNMISGFDLTLETLDELRMHVRDDRIPIYMDVHSLTLGVNEDVTRFHRPVENWRRWLFMLHGVQMNEEEASIMTEERFDEQSLAKQVMSLNTKAMIVTRGAKGYTAFWDEHKQLLRVDGSAVENGPAVDATGCGDVFAAAYCAHYCKMRNITAAAEFANRVAALKVTLAGSADIDKLSAFRLSEILQQESVA